MLGSDNPEDKKRNAKAKSINISQRALPYSFQYIVASLTARHTGEVYCVLSLVILNSEPLLLTGRTTAMGRTAATDNLTLWP